MLTQWSIENFKSFRDRTDIDLAPVSVFAGANSSGKSTIIQSILLLKQTLEYAPANRPLALNGPLLKLGTFDDVKNASTAAGYIAIGWQLDVEDIRIQAQRPQLYYGVSGHLGQPTIKTIAGRFEWDVKPSSLSEPSGGQELLQFQPRLAHSTISATQVGEGSSIISHFNISRSFGGLVRNYPYETDIDEQSKDEVLKPKPDGRIIGASSRHFFPGQLVVQYDAAKERVQRIVTIVLGIEPLFSWSMRDLGDVTIPPEIVRHIEQWFMQGQPDGRPPLSLFPESPTDPVPVGQLARALERSLGRIASRPLPATLNLSALRQDLELMLLKEQRPETLVDVTAPRTTTAAVDYAAQYFTTSVRYLGPLRDEPKPVYPLEALANPTEVGYRGEHTAAVLDLHRDRRISYIPASFIHQNDFPSAQKMATLHDAVVDWLSYVGVASEVSTREFGKFGHQLTVQTQGLNRDHDLTNVGVGVSQVLPIIVMALLAESPSLLIFEQPELHLHPKVQARLADFFLSVALSNKQCIIETHSEYLIERFRRRVAEAEGDRLTRILRIYFTERVEGETKCRPVQVTQYGAIPDWPADFFDQSQFETEHILQAAMEKRTAERGKK
jgi:predicted ATPase